MTIRDILNSEIEFLSDVFVKIYNPDTYDCLVYKPLLCATELYDLQILYIYPEDDEIVIEVESED